MPTHLYYKDTDGTHRIWCTEQPPRKGGDYTDVPDQSDCAACGQEIIRAAMRRLNNSEAAAREAPSQADLPAPQQPLQGQSGRRPEHPSELPTECPCSYCQSGKGRGSEPGGAGHLIRLPRPRKTR